LPDAYTGTGTGTNRLLGWISNRKYEKWEKKKEKNVKKLKG
jgi:hypothetical protein